MGFGSLALTAALALAAAAPPVVSFDARALKPGEVVVVTIDAPAAADAQSVHVTAFGHDVPAVHSGPHQWRAILGIDLDVKPGRYPVTALLGPVRAAQDLIVQPKAFRTRRLTVDPNFVTPPESEARRIEEESKLMASTWKASSATQLWTTSFAAPVPHPANSAFGTRSIFNGTPRNAHGGADFLSPAGTPVHAPAGGRVVIARNLYFSGNTVVIDHGLGVFSMLAHLSAIDVREGDTIAVRDVIGRVGATGRVTGPHLHWAVRVADARVDPLSLLAVLGKP